jgi:hypothetical protein
MAVLDKFQDEDVHNTTGVLRDHGERLAWTHAQHAVSHEWYLNALGFWLTYTGYNGM